MTARRPSLTDIRRALKAATEAGLSVTSYTVDDTGVRVFTATPVDQAERDEQTDELAAIRERVGRAPRRA